MRRIWQIPWCEYEHCATIATETTTEKEEVEIARDVHEGADSAQDYRYALMPRRPARTFTA